MTDKYNLAKFYSGPASILQDHRVLTAVSTFLQSTKDDIIEALRLRWSPIGEQDGRTIGEGYFHYPKKEKRKTRYITEPMPVLRDLQEKMLFMLENTEARNETMKAEMKMYAYQQGHKVESLFANNKQSGLKFEESPYQKVALHRDAHDSTPYRIKMDIAHAYKSLSEEKLFIQLQKLLKSQYPLPPFNALTPLETQKATAILTHLLTYKNSLATGAPTSPYIFHKTLESTDKEIIQVLESLPLEKPTYTRYLDDIIITFSRINTPTSADITGFFQSLLSLYGSFETKDATDILLRLNELLKRMNSFFAGADIMISDGHSKKRIRQQLKELRDFLHVFKNTISERPEHSLEHMIAITDSYMLDDSYIALLQQMLKSIGLLSESLGKQIHFTVGQLDNYKRRLDNTTNTYDINVDSIEEQISSLLQKEGWPINKEKTITRLPDSPSMQSMLGLGINDTNHITVPRKRIKEKINRFLNILYGKIPIPHHLQHSGKAKGVLNYRSLLASIQGYKEYILEIKGHDKNITKKEKMQVMRSMEKYFTHDERKGLRKAEQLCADHFGISVEEAYDLLFSARSPEKEEAYMKKKGSFSGEFGGFDEDGRPIDIRDIPREDAESNRQHIDETVEEANLPFQQQDLGWQDTHTNSYHIPEDDDLPF